MFILNVAARGVSSLINAVTGGPAPNWFPLAILGGWTLYVAGRLVGPKVTQGDWLYKLYRYRSPATSKQLVRPHPSPGILERLYLHIRPPKWCRTSDDELMIIYRDQDKLLHEGALAFGVIVQANTMLFRKGIGNAAPASVLYTTELEGADPIGRMLKAAYKISSLKNTKPDDLDELKFARIISYEYGREFRVTLPASLSEGLDMTYTTIMVHRKHLPFGYLTNYYFPLMVHQESRAAMILPSRYWPEEIISDWTPKRDAVSLLQLS